MVSLASRRQEIATALSGISGLRVESDGIWPDRTNLPAALVRPDNDSEPMVLDMSARYERFELVVAVASTSGLKRGQAALDVFYDSVWWALVANLGGMTDVRRTSYGVVEIDGAEYLGFTLRLEVIDQ
jgi:hypothetical protein